jgi:SAM-dependent methyltransferase
VIEGTEFMERDALIRIARSVGQRHGWDFSLVRDEREPVPWDYAEAVRRYLRPSDRVLDVGTGGGERFLALAPYFDSGVGIDVDPEMIAAARENRPATLADRIALEVMPAESLTFGAGEFDVVLNRHASVHVAEVVRVLRPGGYFVTQQVGPLNTHNICSLFGCGPGGQYDTGRFQTVLTLADGFRQQGCRIICRAEYDVRYWFLDVESFLFWLQAIPIPEDFDIEEHWQMVGQIIRTYETPRGIETNEQRELLIVRKEADHIG